jgi:DNA-directed RNA polymerase specialized sigma subunit
MPGDGVTALGAVLRAARALRTTSGRTPTVGEIAAQAGLEEREVRRALLLAKVMSR